MSNQGWSGPPRDPKNKTTGEKIFDVVTWPFRKVFVGLVKIVLPRFGPRR